MGPTWVIYGQNHMGKPKWDPYGSHVGMPLNNNMILYGFYFLIMVCFSRKGIVSKLSIVPEL